MNGKLGDHPLTDILAHQMPVYSREVDALVAEMVELAGREETEALLRELEILWAPKLVTAGHESRTRVQLDQSSLEKAEQALRSRCDALILKAERSGWDMKALHIRMEGRRLDVYQTWDAHPT